MNEKKWEMIIYGYEHDDANEHDKGRASPNLEIWVSESWHASWGHHSMTQEKDGDYAKKTIYEVPSQ